jgi:hypothetical protein
MQRIEPGSPGASSGGRPAEPAKSTCRSKTCTICSPSACPRRSHSDQAESAAPAPIADLHTLLDHGTHEPHLTSLRDKFVTGSSGCLVRSVKSPNDMPKATLRACPSRISSSDAKKGGLHTVKSKRGVSGRSSGKRIRSVDDGRSSRILDGGMEFEDKTFCAWVKESSSSSGADS